MHFSISQHLPGPPETAARLFANPAFHTSLTGLTKIGTPELLDGDGDHEQGVVRLRYRFIADLPTAVTAVVDPHRLTWVDETTWDLEGLSARTVMKPDHYGSKLAAIITQQFRSDDNNDRSCIRQIEGDLKVKVLLVGSQVERAIVSGLQEHLEEEAIAATAALNT